MPYQSISQKASASANPSRTAGDRGHGRPIRKCGGAAVAGQVRGQYAVAGVELRAQRREVVVGAPDAVQQEQGLARPGAVPEQLKTHHSRRTPAARSQAGSSAGNSHIEEFVTAAPPTRARRLPPFGAMVVARRVDDDRAVLPTVHRSSRGAL
jgi:hypothetical protein